MHGDEGRVFAGVRLRMHRRTTSCCCEMLHQWCQVGRTDDTSTKPYKLQDVHGLTAGHPTPAATDEVPSVIRENTPQERGIAEVPQNVGTEDKLQDPLSEAEVPHKSSDVMAASAEKETAEALPPAEPDQILDAPVSGVEVPQPVVDDREQNTAGVPPPPVPPGIQNEATVLVAEDESSGGVDKAGATAATGDEPGDEGVAEQQPHIEAAAGASEDGTPEPKQEEQAVEPDAVDVGIASDVSVEATPETDEKASTALQVSAIATCWRNLGARRRQSCTSDGHKDRCSRMSLEPSPVLHIHLMRTQSRTLADIRCRIPGVLSRDFRATARLEAVLLFNT